MATSKIQTKRDLLWTNPSPTSSFGARTISLDLSAYSYVEIEYNIWTNIQHYETTGAITKGRTIRMAMYSDYAWYRTAQTSNSGVTFGEAKGYTSYGSSSTVDNINALIPYKIWGIK